MPPSLHLSKTRFLAGLQCLKRLWWQVHEPEAPELAPSPDLRARLEAGKRVGEAARDYVPGGTLIGFRHYEVDQKVEATRAALANGAQVVYEASFRAGDAYAVSDIVERRPEGTTLVEVKATTSAKPDHTPDVALQVHLARASGVAVDRAEVMHLNRECRHPDLTNLFVRTDVTRLVEAFLPEVPDRLARQRAALDGPLPDVAIGDHCFDPYECPFMKRCWPEWPDDHVGRLYLMKRRALELEAAGYRSLADIPDDFKLNAIQARQVRAIRLGTLFVEPELAGALAPFEGPLAFLDFETVSPAIPVWPGCRPWDRVPVQFSIHVERPDAGHDHFAWLAEGDRDPRPEQAERLVAALAGARGIVAYNSPFERDCLRLIAAVAPHLARELGELELKLLDLLPVVRNHVYHARFAGSFSLKTVLPALVPEVTYADLAIRDGAQATLELWRLVFEAGRLRKRERERLRRALLAYCERDSWATVKLLDRLRELAGITRAVTPAPAPAPTGGRRAQQLDLFA